MFAPAISQTKDRLAGAYSSILTLDQFSTASSDIVVVKLPQEPAWLPKVRAELNRLRDLASVWRDARPSIWAPALVCFMDYVPTFNAFVEATKTAHLDKSKWVELLEAGLLPSVTQQVATAKAAVLQLEKQRAGFSAILPSINKSIQSGWVNLGNEEADMLKLAEEIGGLSQLATSYSAKLTSDVIDGGKSYVQSILSLTYAAVAAGGAAAIPILGIATAVFSIGKSFYDVIEDNEHIIETMNRISKLQQELSSDALNLALTKGTLQILYQLEMSYLASRNALPGLVDLWSAEQSKIQDAINALNAGANPDQYLDLLTLRIAKTNWAEISSFVSHLANIDVQMGAPVTLDIQHATIQARALIA